MEADFNIGYTLEAWKDYSRDPGSPSALRACRVTRSAAAWWPAAPRELPVTLNPPPSARPV